MANKKGTAMLMVWADMPADKEEEFNRWLAEEHLAERLSVPGFLSAAKYDATMNGPKHLACYELENAAVIDSPEYKRLAQNPTDWAKRISPANIGTNVARYVYEMIHPAVLTDDIASADMAPALQIGRMGIAPEVEDEWNHWYNTIYTVNNEKVPGVIRARRFRAVTGEPAYSVVYDLEFPEVNQTDEWKAQATAHPDNERIRGYSQHVPGSPGVWKKTIEI